VEFFSSAVVGLCGGDFIVEIAEWDSSAIYSDSCVPFFSVFVPIDTFVSGF